MLQKRDLIGPFEDHVGLVKTLVHFPLTELVVGEEIAFFVESRGIRLHGLLGIEDRRKGLIVHLDESEGLLVPIPRFCRDERDAVPNKTDLVTTDDGLIGVTAPNPFRPGTSPAVSTAATPGSALARSVRMDLMRACGCGLLRILP